MQLQDELKLRGFKANFAKSEGDVSSIRRREVRRMAKPQRLRPFRFYALAALILAAGGTIGLWWLVGGANTVPVWVGCWLVAVNIVAFGYYGYDKVRAGGGDGRVPELVLHGISAIGGSPGAYLAMWLFRHKTVKGSFRILFWCIVILQLCVGAYVAKLLWWT